MPRRAGKRSFHYMRGSPTRSRWLSARAGGMLWNPRTPTGVRYAKRAARPEAHDTEVWIFYLYRLTKSFYLGGAVGAELNIKSKNACRLLSRLPEPTAERAWRRSLTRPGPTRP